ncbi:hypothetical protein Q8A67_008991 [Cirrhinus molitorella]|uniref:Ig-like domain-containing protein n=1 Tax=Cirrhinus molitorella TaxID=172907 RepID=A0AA88TSX2_9TELE|nr:hypothetical protein Q8A67_008991 [Cirrhinus molitorella]
MIHGVEGVSLTQSQKVLVKQKVDGAVALQQKISLTKAEEKLAIIDCQLHYLFVQEQMTVGNKKVFGSGTRLYVTDKIIAPKLSGYLPSAKGPDKHDKQTMLCQASGMFPDLVRFEWKKNGATWNDVSEGDVVEQRNTSPEITVTSILIVDKDKAKNNNYQCSVTHEGSNTGPQILDMKKEDSTQTGESTQNDPVKGTCAPTEDPIKKETSGDSEQISSMSLFVYAYGVMLMKNALFFCVVSVFLLQRRAGKKDEIS